MGSFSSFHCYRMFPHRTWKDSWAVISACKRFGPQIQTCSHITSTHLKSDNHSAVETAEARINPSESCFSPGPISSVAFLCFARAFIYFCLFVPCPTRKIGHATPQCESCVTHTWRLGLWITKWKVKSCLCSVVGATVSVPSHPLFPVSKQSRWNWINWRVVHLY